MGQVGVQRPILRSSFDAVDFSADSAYNAGITHIQPNPSMGAGPRHLVCIAGSSIGIYTKDGAMQRGASLADFFSSLHPLRDPLEPKAIYDQFSGRFLVMAIDRSDTLLGDSTNTSRILLAVSVTDNPIAGWWFVAIDSKLTVAGLEMAAEYPDLAVSAGNVFLCTDMFTLSYPRECGGLRLFIIEKGEIGGFYDGGPAVVGAYAPFSDTLVVDIPRDRLVKMHGAPQYAGEMFLVSYSPVRGSDEGDRLMVTSINVQPQHSVSFWARELAVGNHDVGLDLPDAPQLGTDLTLSTFGKFVYDAVWRSEVLYVTTTETPISGPDVTQATVHWFAIDTYNTPFLTLTGSGDVGGEDIAAGTFTCYPSLSVDHSNNLAIGFAASGSELYPGAYFTAGLANDSGRVYGGSGVLREGLEYYDRSLDPADPGAPSSWGLHTTTCVDPTDGSFWFYNTYAGRRGMAVADSAGARRRRLALRYRGRPRGIAQPAHRSQ